MSCLLNLQNKKCNKFKKRALVFKIYYYKISLFNSKEMIKNNMWQRISALLKPKSGEEKQEQASLEELRLATASLLFRAGNIDGNISEIELSKLTKILKTHFDLSDSEQDKLIKAARIDENKSIDLYGFTRIITDQLDQPGRIAVVELIWEVVLADGVIDEFEANMVWRVAELIGVSARDRKLLKQKVMKTRQ